MALGIAAASVLFLALLPRLPETRWGWLGLLASALPAVVAVEWCAHRLRRNSLAMSLASRGASGHVSLARLAYLLVVMLLACGVAWGMALLLGAS